jgi:Site-specific recombinase XerD
MTASEIKDLIKSNERPPDWIHNQPKQTEKYLYGYWKSTIANNTMHTVRNRSVAVRQFTKFFDDDIADVDTSDVISWKEDMQIKDYAYRSIQSKIYALSTFYNWLIERKDFDDNPVDDVEIDHFEKTKLSENLDREYVTKEEFKQMMEACETTRESVICRLFWDTGIRIGEMVNLKISDINRRKKSIEIISGKTRKMEEDDERTVYYSQSLESILMEWLDNGQRNAYFGSTGDYLILSDEAEKMHKGTLSDMVRNVADRAGVLKTIYTDKAGQERYFPHPHALRKSYGVYRTKGGMPIAYLSNLMGHSDIQTTQDEYLKFRDDDIRDADRRYRPIL